MSGLFRNFSFSLLLLSMWQVPSVFGQSQPAKLAPASFKVVHVIGFESLKRNTKGQITLSKDTVEVVMGSRKSDLSINWIQDVITGADSERLIGGTLGTLTIFAPYESGRFLSLFRTNIDTLTISYRDSGGGLHGAIFTLSQGQASVLKRQMVAAGAKTSISAEDETKQQSESKMAKEKKP